MNGFEVASCLILGVGTFALLVALTQWIVNKQQRAYDQLPIRPLVDTLCKLAEEQPGKWKDLGSFWSYQPIDLVAYLHTDLSLDCDHYRLYRTQLNRKERTLIQEALHALRAHKDKKSYANDTLCREGQALVRAQNALLRAGGQHGT